MKGAEVEAASGETRRFDFVTFLTDYGLDDEYVAVCHGVIYSLAPHVRILDVCHLLPPYSTRSAALMLVRAVQYMPPAVHLAVVDPGVGTSRRAVAVETEEAVLVGPDNGLLSPAAQMLGGALRAVEITNEEFRLPQRGGLTFAGRDIFAPAAAALAGSATLDDLGPEIGLETLVPMVVPLPRIEDDRIDCEVLWVDRFGNCEVNVSPEELSSIGAAIGEDVKISVAGAESTAVWARAFGDVEAGTLAILEDHYGLLSLAVSEGNAARKLGLEEGVAVTLRR
jgi:S-adenosylmethionine hydrolase